jgi:RNA polymerase sigma-70 factor (ECF subfamily)
MEEGNTARNEGVAALIDRINAGDKEAFMTVTSLYQKKVFLLAYSFFNNKDDALDIVQETFFRFYQKAHLFKKGRNFQNWLLQMAKNLCIDYYRKHHSKKHLYDVGKNIEEMNPSSENKPKSGESVELKDVFSRCLEKLSERQRLIFVLKQYNQLEYKEIAQVLNIANGTVKSLHFKAVQNLRALMRPYLGGSYEGL